MKEPQILLFFRGARYVITYAKEGYFSQFQTVLLLDLPSNDDIENWRSSEVSVYPPSLKDIQFYHQVTKALHLEVYFKEVKIRITPERTQLLGNNIQSQRGKYGLEHHVTEMIHSTICDTIISMATDVSVN